MGKKKQKIKVSPQILKSLREISGLSKEGIAKKLGVSVKEIEDVENGRNDFTLSQIKKLAFEVYKIPLAAFFTEEIPPLPSLPDYRINRGKKLTPEVYMAIRRAQCLAYEIKELSDKRSEIPSFPMRLSPNEMADKFKEFSDVKPPKLKEPGDILSYYKKVLEEKLNILIIEYPLKAEDVRAFSISDDLSVLVLNEQDEPQVKLFSLFHEIAHLLKHTNGICSIELEGEKEDIERFCDEFAAEFLVPREDLEKEVEETGVDDEGIDKLSKRFGVSKQVIMLRLLKFGYIDPERYRNFKAKFDEAKLKKKEGYRDWNKVFLNRAGNLAVGVVSDAYKKRKITLFEASQILNVKLKYAESFLK